MPRWQASQSRRPTPWPSVVRSDVHNRMAFVKQTVSLRSFVKQTVSLRTELLLLATVCILLSGVSVFAQKRKSRTTKPMPAVVAVDAAGLQALLKRDDAKPLLVNYWA